MRVLNRTLVIGLALILISASAFGVTAQAAPPVMRITQAGLLKDVPLVTADLALVDANGGSRGGLTAADFNVFEDDKPVRDFTVVTVTEKTAGLAVVIVLDTGANITNGRGVIGARRWDDLREVSDDRAKNGLISELIKYRLTNIDFDWIGLVGVGREVTPVVTLVRDGNVVLNAIGPMTPYNKQTPLRAGITRALKLFESPDAPADLPANVQKLILVFSDGIDIIPNQDIYTDLYLQARDAHIAYYTIGMKSPGSVAGYESLGLKRIADQTGGVFGEYGSVGQRAEVLALFDRLATQRQQYHLEYVTHAAQGTHTLRIETADGQATATTNFISTFQMPTIRIEVSPLDLQKGEAVKTVIITPTWQEIDGYKRPPAKIEYLVNSKITSTVTTLAPLVWDISTLPDEDREYIFEVRAYDSILVDAPAATSNLATVKVKRSAIKEVVEPVRQNWLGLLLLPLVIFLLIIVIPNRKKITQTAKATTMRLQQAATRRLTPASAARYKLMALSLGQEYPLTERIMRVGRDPNSNIYLSDLSVSTAHADLTEDQSGTYMVADLASTNGSFVNGVPLQRGPVPGQPGPALLLRAGDMIRFGSIELRFDYAKVTRRLPPGS